MSGRLRRALVRQFGRPDGSIGSLAGWIMAVRPSNRQRNRWTVDVLGIGPHDRVLEVGFGPGLALHDCCKRAVRGRVVGLDHSEVMLAQAARRNREAVERGQLRLIRGSLDQLESTGGPFDKLFSVNLVQFLPDKTQAYRAFHGILAPGGLIATTYMPRTHKPTRADALRVADDIVACMLDAGFDAIRVEVLELRPVPAICVLAQKPHATDAAQPA